MLDGFGECDEVILFCRACSCAIVTQSLLHFSVCSADSLEEIVGLDISYHGDFHARATERNDSINDDDEIAYYERREQLREKQRNKIRRRILMMDISLSRGRNSVSHAEEFRTGDIENPDDDVGLPTGDRMTI
jgi:hypothetical protein